MSKASRRFKELGRIIILSQHWHGAKKKHLSLRKYRKFRRLRRMREKRLWKKLRREHTRHR